MLTDNDNSGIFTFMIGVIVLVMFGIGLSLLVDKRFKFSNGVAEIRREIGANAAEIEEMNSHKDESERVLIGYGVNLKAESNTQPRNPARLEALRQRQLMLQKSRIQIRESITALEGDFSHYRADYRRKTWTGAIGESLGTLTTRAGRVFQQATIIRVTDVGLEIRHEHGTARIQAPDLDPKMRNRFQWSDEERRSRLKEELENQWGKVEVADPANPETPNNGNVAIDAIPEAPVSRVNRNYQNIPAVDADK